MPAQAGIAALVIARAAHYRLRHVHRMPASAGMTRARPMNAAPKTLRQLSELFAAGLASPESRAELERVAAQYAVAITPAMAELIVKVRKRLTDWILVLMEAI